MFCVWLLVVCGVLSRVCYDWLVSVCVVLLLFVLLLYVEVGCCLCVCVVLGFGVSSLCVDVGFMVVGALFLLFAFCCNVLSVVVICV